MDGQPAILDTNSTTKYDPWFMIVACANYKTASIYSLNHKRAVAPDSTTSIDCVASFQSDSNALFPDFNSKCKNAATVILTDFRIFKRQCIRSFIIHRAAASARYGTIRRLENIDTVYHNTPAVRGCLLRPDRPHQTYCQKHTN